jgi:hypothetical protein
MFYRLLSRARPQRTIKGREKKRKEDKDEDRAEYTHDGKKYGDHDNHINNDDEKQENCDNKDNKDDIVYCVRRRKTRKGNIRCGPNARGTYTTQFNSVQGLPLEDEPTLGFAVSERGALSKTY